jgi:hypothetical protein
MWLNWLNDDLYYYLLLLHSGAVQYPALYLSAPSIGSTFIGVE